MKPVVEIEGLTKMYKNNRGIQDVTMTVRQGDIYGFFGPNGAGKTTVMKIMAGLSRAQRGTVKLLGYDVAEQYEQAMSKVGVLIETAEVYSYMSGRKNLELAAKFYPHVTSGRIDEVLEIVGLTPFQHEKAAGYSLGMKQRLGLAAALLSGPELMILDEPTNGLDIEGMVQMRDIMMRLAREQRITFLISSHLIHEMELMCNRIGIIHQGRLLCEASVPYLLEQWESLEAVYMHHIQEDRKVTLHA
ncbi:ABC transporter ATP-binding protein [Paenibacillus hexagrammi]|uniref:ATP-binding cassette domain-containing protein n=1 Tax=Paenibacillus hexagrammi TaxID=2908839 RepID=A0ABY3SJI2_9BACL|nr:ATP-binding cassette domain-containing protein [Paenibacillus sp. YPD9-1]UJF34178.1 ATP-binding cassette domain-containing protein [Paenibacillus sp. YPD9-1]